MNSIKELKEQLGYEEMRAFQVLCKQKKLI